MSEKGSLFCFGELCLHMTDACEVCNSLSLLVPSYTSKCSLVSDVSQRQSIDYNCLDAGVNRVLI